MIDFMIIGAPRSGTAWAANWLTNGADMCWHDPLFTIPLEELDTRIVANPGGNVGIADTGIWRFPEYLANHKARKVILHRSIVKVNDSLERSGLPPISGPEVWSALYNLEGVHCNWDVLFAQPDFIYFNLFRRHMSDYEYRRHELLTKLNVQVDFEKVDPDPEVTRRLLERMRTDVR